MAAGGVGSRLAWSAVAALTLGGLAACGGGQGDGEGARGFAAAMAQAGTSAGSPEGMLRRLDVSPVLPTPSPPNTPVPVQADDWFNWIERTFPETFPAGPQTQTVFYIYRSYLVRYYPGQDTYLGVSGDGHVHALGPFTGGELQGYGQLVNYTCLINPSACQPAEQASIQVWNWAGTQQCRPNDFPQRLAALRQQLASTGVAVSGGQCAWTLEYVPPAVCGALDGRMAVLNVPLQEFPRALAQGWRPFRDGVNGDLNHPTLSPCEAWSPS
jgi:hypothetical protein